jgi:hypothetical protein
VVPERTEAAPERRAEVLGGLLGRDFCIRFRRFEARGMPEVDVQQLDLLDQEEDRAPGGPDLVPAVVQQPLAPCPQSFELVFVEAVRRTSLLGLPVARRSV